jgi:predicted ATP-binding protein involved in virulence
MRHSDGAGNVFTLYEFFKVGNLAFAFENTDVVVQQADPGAVITTVLQPVQTLHQDWISFAGSDIGDYSTHKEGYFFLII